MAEEAPMTGHHARRQAAGAHRPTPADPLLDQLAQHVTVARASGNAAVAKLAEAEAAFTAGVLSRLEGVDAPTVGAVLLAAGYYAGEFLKTLVGTDGPTAAASAINVIQLAGQQLYTARVKSKAVCGLPWPSGKACTQTYEAADDETLAAMMRGHVALSHPGQEWSAHAGSEPERSDFAAEAGEAFCACGEPAELIVGITNRPDGQCGEAKAQCQACASRDARESTLHESIKLRRPHPVIREFTDGTTQRVPRHAPHELCDCRPGETYHCAAAADGEAQS